MTALTSIEGLERALAEKLRAAGVDSCEALLVKGASPDGRKRLSAAIGIDEQFLLRLVDHVDLMRIKGIGAEQVGLLERAGVDSVPALAQLSPTNLLVAVIQLSAEKQQVRVPPGSGQIVKWIEQAKTLPRIVVR